MTYFVISWNVCKRLNTLSIGICIRNVGFFPVLDCSLNFPFFQYSGFLALQSRFLNFSRFSPWFLKFSKKKNKKTFFTKNNLLHCTFWWHHQFSWIFGLMALCHGTVNQLCELFWYYKERISSKGVFIFCFLTWIFWVLRFLFPWTFTNSFLRP